LNDVAEIKRVFPENEYYNDLENKRNVAKQTCKAAQFIFVATVLFILLGGT